MRSMAPQEDLDARVFGVLAALLPFGLLVVHRGLGHEGDLAFFHEWYLAFRDGAGFYRDGPGLNYPIVGVLLVCGPAWLLEQVVGAPLDLEGFIVALKVTVTLGEVALVLCVEALARALRIPRPRLVALGIYVLPSSWAGAAWFGQIDVWGSALLLASAAALVTYRRAPRHVGALAVGLVSLHLALLTKQLAWFSLPGLGLLLASGVRKRPAHIVAAALSCLLWLAPDPWLALPDGYASHLGFVLFGGGSAHGDLIVGGGASLWSLLLGPGGDAHARELMGLSVFVWGWLLFGAAQVPALWWLWRRRDEPRAYVLYVGYANLAMTTLLTGVHERYLAHGAPFLLLGLGALTSSRAAHALMAAALSWWGLFVLASLHFDAPLLWPFRHHQPVAGILVVTLGLLALALARSVCARAGP